ncbi:MAG: hypothetical protein AMJ81_14590 [Phycisphaerae bacterium SM23_33]|nr:MAG: hypothetical protein AMJ81_14590 [Phycisphaerae bacterium SM23_33]
MPQAQKIAAPPSVASRASSRYRPPSRPRPRKISTAAAMPPSGTRPTGPLASRASPVAAASSSRWPARTPAVREATKQATAAVMHASSTASVMASLPTASSIREEARASIAHQPARSPKSLRPMNHVSRQLAAVAATEASRQASSVAPSSRTGSDMSQYSRIGLWANSRPPTVGYS